MSKPERDAFIALPFILLVGAGFALAGSHGAPPVAFGVPAFTLTVATAFLIQWVAFIPAYIYQTEKYFDLVGGGSYVAVTIVTLLLSGARDPRSLLLAAMVIVWAMRLASFLFRRIHHSGKDGRFDAMKPSALRFGMAWTLQGLWITFTAAAALAAIASPSQPSLDGFAMAGTLIWITGFALEVVADRQKDRFRRDPANKGKFIASGLWARSRHPNYFGEITLWTGVAVVAFPALQGWQYLTLLSPAFVAILLLRISGIPMLEERADAKWGGQADYEAYKQRTPVLVPRLR